MATPRSQHHPKLEHQKSEHLLDRLRKERSSLYEDLTAAYGSNQHGTYTADKVTGKEFLTDYEPMKLSSLRVFFLARGTIMKNPTLFTEQLLITLIFLACATPVYVYFKEETHNDVSLSRFIRQQEGKMRAFAGIMQFLTAFMLSFYTAITVGRWWTMRAQGIGGLKAAVVDLHMLLQQCVDPSEQMLEAVRRYGRASLLLIFLWRKKELDRMKQIMGPERYNILTDEECDLLEKAHCRHETIWAWQVALVTKLKEAGKVKSDQLFIMLLKKCTEGRAAVQCIHTHLAVKIPMQYVHLLGLLVKMHNLVLSIIMGLLFGAALRNGYTILCVQLFARLLILPFLFNAILLINCDLGDPFNGEEADFPGELYQAALGADCVGLSSAAKNALPLRGP
mmetsp:Transcript_51621/g.81964  ORF Transcript_51621/g.81964 Transcript_51621/m.81964 type:complete len:394 (+) Transcript_51621:224-1405(+)